MTDIQQVRTTDRYTDDKGRIAVVYSPGYGAGWSTWIDGLSPLDPVIARLVHEGRKDEITDDLMTSLGFEYAYLSGKANLKIQWVQPGTPFQINDYDGAESVVLIPDNIWRA